MLIHDFSNVMNLVLRSGIAIRRSSLLRFATAICQYCQTRNQRQHNFREFISPLIDKKRIRPSPTDSNQYMV